MYVAFALLLTMLFATLNLYLGFATVVYWRRPGTPAGFNDYLRFLVHGEALTWDLFLPGGQAAPMRASSPLEQAALDLAGSQAATPPAAAPSTTGALEASLDETAGGAVEEPPAPTPDHAPDVSPTPDQAEQEEEDLEALLRSPGESSESAKASKPASLAVFESAREHLEEFSQELAKLDHHLREVVASPTGEALEACGVALNEAVGRRIKELREAFTPLLLDSDPPQTPSPLRASFDQCVSAAGDRIDALLANLVGLSFNAQNPASSTIPLLEAHAKTLVAVHALRAELTQKLVAVVRDEVGLSKLAPHLRSDQQTGLASRSGFETWVDDLLQGAPSEASLILIDVDSMNTVNQQFGATAGDGVVSIVAQFVAKARQREQLAARIDGQQFALVCGSMSARDIAETGERIRQSIEKTTFRYRGQTLRVTVSVAVSPIRAGDGVDSILERALTTVREAKSYGRNRTFLCEEECPAPVVPPEMNIEEQEVTL
ncbi:MAG: GGDEF domain-containing protein [Pirellulaceae bacterium]